MRISDWSSDVCSSDLMRRSMRAKRSIGATTKTSRHASKHATDESPNAATGFRDSSQFWQFCCQRIQGAAGQLYQVEPNAGCSLHPNNHAQRQHRVTAKIGRAHV